VFVADLYLFFLLGLSLIALLYFGVSERHDIKQINPFGFMIVFLKILFLTIIQVVFIFLPVFGGMIIERTFYPWIGNPVLYIGMGIASGLVGLFFIFQIANLMNLDPGEKQLKYWAILILLFYTIVSVAFFGIDIAYYFTAPMLLFLVSLRISGAVWSFIIGGVGVLPVIGSIGLTQITIAMIVFGIPLPALTLMATVFILSLPFVFYFAAAMQPKVDESESTL